MRARIQLEHVVAALAAVAVLAVTPAPARAQSAHHCASIESDTERLACYDCSGLAAENDRLACYDRTLRPAPEPSILEAPARAPRPAAAAEPAAPAAPPAARSAPAAPVEPRDADREAAGDDEEETVRVVVVAVRRFGHDARFTTEDGAVWVQTDGRSMSLPETPFAAELKPGAMGSTFLVPADRRAIRVRRAD